MTDNQHPLDVEPKEAKSSDTMPVEKESGETDTLGPEEEKRLVRKIDLQYVSLEKQEIHILTSLMPLLIISYGLQYLDKTSLAYSAILGIREDLNLVGQEFNWASSIFYIGYLVASYPISLGFVRFPLGRYLSLLILLWGIILTLHAAAENYAGLMVLRTFLGIFESAISPGFSLITGMWYTPKEHMSRHSFWFAGNATASIIGSMIAYGILHYAGGFSQWKMLFLIFGLITICWSVVLWLYLPDAPSNARFLTPTEREFASLRPKKFQRTTQTKQWDKTQFTETFQDPKTWWFLLFSFVICVPNGGITSFNSIIINSFGYDKYQTILMGLPASAFQLTTVILAAVFTTLFRKSRLWAVIATFLMAMAGVLMIKLLPTEKKLSRLAGYWLVTAVSPAFPLMMSLFASNTAGFTKKSTVVALIFVGYCVGNFVGPQFFKNQEAPGYETAYTTILTCFAITIVMAILLRIYLAWTNSRRDREQGVHVDPEDSRGIDLHADEELEGVDETDMQNRGFRYIL